jgi:acetyl esterase/lipase
MHDSARTLQFLRSKASQWNIDPTRIAAAGGSAGACTSLWIAYLLSRSRVRGPTIWFRLRLLANSL